MAVNSCTAESAYFIVASTVKVSIVYALVAGTWHTPRVMIGKALAGDDCFFASMAGEQR